MSSLLAILLLSAAPGSAPAMPAPAQTRVSASAQATVRILPGARVSLSGQAEAEGYRLTNAVITAEDGSQRSAKLVEFQ